MFLPHHRCEYGLAIWRRLLRRDLAHEDYKKALTDAIAAGPEKLDIDWVARSSTLSSQILAADASAPAATAAPAAPTAAAAVASPSNGSEQDEINLGTGNDDGELRTECL